MFGNYIQVIIFFSNSKIDVFSSQKWDAKLLKMTFLENISKFNIFKRGLVKPKYLFIDF